MTHSSLCAALLAATTLAVAPQLVAQQLDRTAPPTLAAPAPLTLPPVSVTRLPNGATLYLVEMHKVPMVQILVRIRAGARFEGSPNGLASFTADMLSEGAGARDAAGIAAEQAYLGANLAADASWDYITIGLNAPVRTFEPSLDLLADLIRKPRFRSADVVRLRNLRIARIVAERNEPGSVADEAFNATVFPAGHPYHHPLDGDSTSVAAFDSATVRRFHQRAFIPNGAAIIVTGDIKPAEAVRLLNAHLGGWHKSASAALPAPVTATPAAQVTTVTLVDKPDAAQSAIVIGAPGVARNNPDFAALEVMNTILGGSFSSRINQNLREIHGYTYGAQTDFIYRPLTGPFEAAAAVRSDVTDSSLAQLFAEFGSIRDSLVTDTELHRAINYLVLGLPSEFQTTGQMADKIEGLLTFHLPFDYYQGYGRAISAVTAADVQRVARQYLDPAHLSVIVVGDLATIMPGIEALRLGPIVVRKVKGPARGH